MGQAAGGIFKTLERRPASRPEPRRRAKSTSRYHREPRTPLLSPAPTVMPPHTPVSLPRDTGRNRHFRRCEQRACARRPALPEVGTGAAPPPNCSKRRAASVGAGAGGLRSPGCAGREARPPRPPRPAPPSSPAARAPRARPRPGPAPAPPSPPRSAGAGAAAAGEPAGERAGGRG